MNTWPLSNTRLSNFTPLNWRNLPIDHHITSLAPLFTPLFLQDSLLHHPYIIYPRSPRFSFSATRWKLVGAESSLTPRKNRERRSCSQLGGPWREGRRKTDRASEQSTLLTSHYPSLHGVYDVQRSNAGLEKHQLERVGDQWIRVLNKRVFLSSRTWCDGEGGTCWMHIAVAILKITKQKRRGVKERAKEKSENERDS